MAPAVLSSKSPKVKAQIVSGRIDENNIYCEIHSNDLRKNGDPFSFGSFRITSCGKPDDLEVLQDLFDQYSESETLPPPEEFRTAIKGHSIFASFGIDTATIASGYSDLYRQLGTPQQHPELVVIPIEKADFISSLASEISGTLCNLKRELETHSDINRSKVENINVAISNLCNDDKDIAANEFGELWKLANKLPTPEDFSKQKNLPTSLADWLVDSLPVSPNNVYQENYEKFKELISNCSYARAEHLFSKKNDCAKIDRFNYDEVNGAIRWFTVSPTDHRSLEEISKVTSIPFELLVDDHPNHPDLTHPKGCNRVILNTITIHKNREGVLTLRVEEAIVIFNDETLIVQANNNNTDVERLKNEILNADAESLNGLTPSLLAARLIRTNLHSLKRAVDDLDKVVSAFVAEPLGIPTVLDLQNADAYTQWASKIKANGIYMKAVVQRFKEKKTHHGKDIDMKEQISSYNTITESVTEIAALVIDKLNGRTTGWDHQIDRQDSSLNLQLTALAGFVVPATVVSSMFGQNIVGITGAPLWAVVTANVSAIALGGILTYSLYKKKNKLEKSKTNGSIFRSVRRP